ncbi:MAG: M20/M25/M40 family metallo-hydrolase [Alphaproteobacteria bacterium]
MADSKALSAILAESRDEQRQFLGEIVRVASDNPPGDGLPHAERTAALLERLGFSVERHPVPAALVERHGMRRITNLIVRERFGAGPTIALSAHGDVVPPGEGWSVDPYSAEIRNGTMYGRGVAVSKSDFATYAFALLALKRLGAPLRGTVELHLTYDEEAGGYCGPHWLLERKITRPDAVIYAGFAYAIATSHKGCLHLEVTVRGRSAHAAEPWRGADALEAAQLALGRLYRYREELATVCSAIHGIGSPTLVIGLIEGGINTNVVPDRVTFRLDRRLVPEERAEEAERAIQRIVREACQSLDGTEPLFRRIMLAEALRPAPGTDALVSVLQRHAEQVIGGAIPVVGLPLYTDARHYAAAGIPVAIYGAGPRTIAEAGGHGPDERLVLADLDKATSVVASTLAELLGG